MKLGTWITHHNIVMYANYANYDTLVCYMLIACYAVCFIHWISRVILCVDQMRVNQMRVVAQLAQLAHLRLRLPERLRPRPLPPLRPLDRDRELFLPPTAGILFVCGILT